MPPDPRRAAAPDTGLWAALRECIGEQGLAAEAKAHAGSIYAGAIGAAIRGAFRYDKLAALGQLPTCLRRNDLPSVRHREVGAPVSRRQEAS